MRELQLHKTIDFKITIFKFLFVLMGIQCPLDCPLSQNCNLGSVQKLIYALPLDAIESQRDRLIPSSESQLLHDSSVSNAINTNDSYSVRYRLRSFAINTHYLCDLFAVGASCNKIMF